MAASPAAKGRLSRPRLKEKLRPVRANLRAFGIWRCDPQKHKSGIRVVGIGRRKKLDRPRRRFRRMLRQPSLALHDPFHDLAHGHALACHSILISPLLKRFFHRYLARATMVSYGESPFPQCVERGGLWGTRGGWASPKIAAAALGEPARVRCRTGAGLIAHDAGSSRRGSRPVLADQRSIATST